MIKKAFYVSLIVITISFIIFSIYMNITYFFNPFDFKQDRITFLPYICYRKTMAYTYGEGGYSEKKAFIKNDQHIRFLFEQFKQSKIIGNGLTKSRFFVKPLGSIQIYSDIENRASIVSQFCWYEKSGIAEVEGKIDSNTEGILYIKMTPKLVRFLKENFKVK